MGSERDELTAALVREMPAYVSAAVRYQIAVADQLGLPLTDLHAVGALLEFGPLGVRRLAELMGMTPSAVTRVADRLERDGYVTREPDPEDRRRVVLRAEPARVEEIAHHYQPMAERWRDQVTGLSTSRLRFLVEFLRDGREYTRAETTAMRTRGRAHATRRPKPS